MKSRWTSLTMAFGACAVLLGMAASSPASALDRDDWRDKNEVRRDVRDINRIEDRLRDLQYRRDIASRRHDWRAVRFLDDQISDARRDLERNRRELYRDRRDVRDDRRDDWRRDRDRRDDWRWR